MWKKQKFHSWSSQLCISHEYAIPCLNFKYISISDVNMWEGGGDVSRKMLHIVQQATESSKYITTYNIELYQICQVFVAILLLPMWLLLGSVEDVVTALYFLVGMLDWSDLDVTAATSSEAARLVRCFQTPFPESFEVVTTGCRLTPSSPSDGCLLWSHMSVKLHNKYEYCIRSA